MKQKTSPFLREFQNLQDNITLSPILVGLPPTKCLWQVLTRIMFKQMSELGKIICCRTIRLYYKTITPTSSFITRAHGI